MCRISQGNLAIDRQFTGQILDSTGLYYYNARYYDPTIGKFISPDTEGIDFNNPQTLNRYTYCDNNPLRYTDPTGHSFGSFCKNVFNKAKAAVSTAVNIAKADPMGVITAVVCIAALAIVAAPLVMLAAGMITTAVATAAVGTVAAAEVTAAITEGPEITADLTNAVNTAETVMEGGDAYLNSAGSGLPETMQPETLYHYTSMDSGTIMNQGINNPSTGLNYLTDDPNLSPTEAQTELNLGADRPAPTHLYGVNVSSLLNSGRELYGPYTITGPDGLPTGHFEWITPNPIPPPMINPIR